MTDQHDALSELGVAETPPAREPRDGIDLDHLALGELEVHADLPAGGQRILQKAHGYLATFVNGVKTRENDRDTGARPGRLVRPTAIERA